VTPGQRRDAIHQARRLTAEVAILPGGDLVQMLANGLGGAGDRQDVLEQVMPKEIRDAQRLSTNGSPAAVLNATESESR
jgi:hypothetical protein